MTHCKSRRLAGKYRMRPGLSRAAAIERFAWDQICVRSVRLYPLLRPHAEQRLGDFEALPVTDSTTSAALLTFRGRSGTSPHQSWALSAVSLDSALKRLQPWATTCSRFAATRSAPSKKHETITFG